LNFVSSQSDFSANKKAAMTSQTIQKKNLKKKRKTQSEKSTLQKKGREGKQKKKTGGENVFQLN